MFSIFKKKDCYPQLMNYGVWQVNAQKAEIERINPLRAAHMQKELAKMKHLQSYSKTGKWMLNPDMSDQELRLHMGELTANEIRVARAAIRWANSVKTKGASDGD